MEAHELKIQERNKEIGLLLKETRMQKNIPLTTCASIIGTSRRRYMALEQGEAMIGAAELEIIVGFLDIPPHKVWRVNNMPLVPRQITLEALPGEKLQIVIDVQK